MMFATAKWVSQKVMKHLWKGKDENMGEQVQKVNKSIVTILKKTLSAFAFSTANCMSKKL
jgi:hypothetical protein